jgi:hypothetical protein
VVKIALPVTQLLMAGCGLSPVMRKGHRCGRQQSNQGQGSQQCLFEGGIHNDSSFFSLSIGQTPNEHEGDEKNGAARYASLTVQGKRNTLLQDSPFPFDPGSSRGFWYCLGYTATDQQLRKLFAHIG